MMKGNIDILMISESKLDNSFPDRRFPIAGVPSSFFSAVTFLLNFNFPKKKWLLNYFKTKMTLRLVIVIQLYRCSFIAVW